MIASEHCYDEKICLFYYCCDRKSRAAYAQSFALWQQATIEFTCHDYSIIACSRHIYVWCCSSRTSRSWWITQSTQHHRRGYNTIILTIARCQIFFFLKGFFKIKPRHPDGLKKNRSGWKKPAMGALFTRPTFSVDARKVNFFKCQNSTQQRLRKFVSSQRNGRAKAYEI